MRRRTAELNDLVRFSDEVRRLELGDEREADARSVVGARTACARTMETLENLRLLLLPPGAAHRERKNGAQRAGCGGPAFGS